MSQEDCDIYYFDARNADLPLVVGGAVARGLVQLDEIGAPARDLIAETAARLRAVLEEPVARIDPADLEPPEDPAAVVSTAPSRAMSAHVCRSPTIA